jgi:hypothetical protein
MKYEQLMANRRLLAGTAALLFLSTLSPTYARNLTTEDDKVASKAKLDPVEFIKRFTIGMTYSELQQALPREVEQDLPSYLLSEEVFMLTVEISGPSGWSATFKFDTQDTAIRRPEQLIEISCSAVVSSRNDPFEAIVRKVAASYGEPLQLDRTQDKFQEAGWRVKGGSVLKLEYSIVPSSLAERDASIDLTVKKNKPRATSRPRAVA